MAIATVETPATLHPVFSFDRMLLRFNSHMATAQKLEEKGATIKNRLYEARAVEVATMLQFLASTPDELAQAEDLREQAEARAFNHKAVKEERAIRRAEFKAANPTATEQE